MQQDAKKRFSRTVEHYISYRPGYPEVLLDFICTHLNLFPDAIIADVGSGTGKLTELFLHHGNPVFAIEPNPDMRLAAEQLLYETPNFNSIDGSAEATTLPDHSVDFIAAGTAFHWFDLAATQEEWRRILRPDGWVLLIWNYRANERSDFMIAYEDFLLQHSTDYKKVKEVYPGEVIFDRFFGVNTWKEARFENSQVFDFEGLKGRYLSCSYALPEDDPAFATAMAALKRIFDRFQKAGKITHWYHTVLYFGKLK